VDEIWDSSPSEVKIMSEANPWSSIWKLQCPLLLFTHSFSFSFLSARSVCSTAKKPHRSQNEKAKLNQRIRTQARKSFKHFSYHHKYV
jgi:hypothetical protein